MGTQTLYQSWQARLRLLAGSTTGVESGTRTEQRKILKALLARYENDALAQQLARFPVHDAPPVVQHNRFNLNWRRPLTLLREKLEARAKARIEPVVDQIAELDPQADALRHLRAQRRARRSGVRREGGTVAALLHFDVFQAMRESVAKAAERAPELLFADVGRVPAEFARLTASYARSMLRVLSHADTRDTVEYVVEELEQHDAESEARPVRTKRRAAAGKSQLFMDRRAMLVHAHAREKERDIVLTTQRVLHPVSDRSSGAAQTPVALVDVLVQNLRRTDGVAIDAYGQKLIEENGRALDEFAARLDHRLFFTDDVLKTFCVNLVYVSKAVRLLNRYGLGSKNKDQRWMAGAEAESREQLHDQFAELLRDPELRARALHHFRLELADGTSAIRFTAIAMVGRLGTLDDIGLLLDLASLLPRSPGNRAERAALLNAARRIAGIENPQRGPGLNLSQAP